MIANTPEVFKNLTEDPNLLKCVGISRIVRTHEFENTRIRSMEESWLIDSIAKGLIEHNLVKFEAERMADGNVKVSCLLYAVDPKADNQHNDNPIK